MNPIIKILAAATALTVLAGCSTTVHTRKPETEYTAAREGIKLKNGDWITGAAFADIEVSETGKVRVKGYRADEPELLPLVKTEKLPETLPPYQRCKEQKNSEPVCTAEKSKGNIRFMYVFYDLYNPDFKQGTVKTVKPLYPALSEEEGEEGKVKVRIITDKNGKVVGTEILKSSGYERLDNAARETAEKYQIEPSVYRGKKVPIVIRVPFNFQLMH